MEIRFADIEDTPGIIALLRQVGGVHHQGRPDIFRDHAQKYGPSQVISMLESFKTPIFVAVEDKKVLGYCFCMIKEHKEDPVIRDYTELYIDDLCVDEGCRGQNIGTALYENAVRYAKMRGCYNVTLNVWNFDGSAQRFYEKLGLKVQKIGMEMILEEADAGKK